MIKLPGLIDPHVHLRDPGQTHKEDFFTGTTAAIFGGYTTVCDMPNNKIPVTTVGRLNEKIKTAKKKIVCDTGFYFGTIGDNFDQFPLIYDKVYGLKLYLNQTTGNYLIGGNELENIYRHWQSDKPILIHAEDSMLEKVFSAVKKTKKKTHICHVSSKDELRRIIEAKKNNLPVTCGVTPHHLFLTEKDNQLMKPTLKTVKDQAFLWQNIKLIDVVESDHAPHTIEEKTSANPPFGVPGLETTLPLLLTRLPIDEIIRLCFIGPQAIFDIPFDPDTHIVVDEKYSYTIENRQLKTKCRFTPFAGRKVKGKVQKVVMRGKTVMENDKLLVQPGFGKII